MMANPATSAIVNMENEEDSDSAPRHFTAPMAIMDKGATPMNVPMQKGQNGTSITGDETFMNQLGRMGVTLNTIIYNRM